MVCSHAASTAADGHPFGRRALQCGGESGFFTEKKSTHHLICRCPFRGVVQRVFDDARQVLLTPRFHLSEVGGKCRIWRGDTYRSTASQRGAEQISLSGCGGGRVTFVGVHGHHKYGLAASLVDRTLRFLEVKSRESAPLRFLL